MVVIETSRTRENNFHIKMSVVGTRNYRRSGRSVCGVWSTKSRTVSVITTQFHLLWSLLMKTIGINTTRNVGNAFPVIFGHSGTKCFPYSQSLSEN